MEDPDAETVDVMNLFFTYLSQGQSGAEALRNAQLAIIKARPPSIPPPIRFIGPPSR